MQHAEPLEGVGENFLLGRSLRAEPVRGHALEEATERKFPLALGPASLALFPFSRLREKAGMRAILRERCYGALPNKETWETANRLALTLTLSRNRERGYRQLKLTASGDQS